MVKSRPREQSEMIIRTKKNPLIEVWLFVSSIMIWVYVAYAFMFFVTSIFNLSIEQINLLKIIINIKNKEVTSFLMAVLFYWVLVTGLLYAWVLYSKYKYGRASKSNAQVGTYVSDLLALDYIDEHTYDALQNAKTITFERNPIHDKKVES